MATLDNGFKMEQVCKKYEIPVTSLRDITTMRKLN